MELHQEIAFVTLSLVVIKTVFKIEFFIFLLSQTLVKMVIFFYFLHYIKLIQQKQLIYVYQLVIVLKPHARIEFALLDFGELPYN
jgi:hypothetical protein